MEKIKVMLMGAHDNRVYEVKNLLKHDGIAIVGVAKIGDNALEKVSSLRPQVVLIQCGEEHETAIQIAQNIYTQMPGCCVFLLCNELDISIIEKAMLAGVRRVVQLPVDGNELAHDIQAAYMLEMSRLQNDAPAAATMQSKVITVFGSKGGIGKTTIAVNMAVVLAQMNKRVAIIDADLQFGDVNVFFDVESKNTIAEISQTRDASDINAIKRMTVLHQSGVSILCAPKSPEYSEYVTAKNVETIITTMRPYYDYIIIDTTPLFNDVTVTAIENSDLVLLVTGIDISTLRNTKTSLGIFESLQQMDKVEIVINKISNSIITIKDVLRILDRPVKNQISYDFKTALASHNKGVPIVLSYPRTAIAREITQLTKNAIEIIGKNN